MRRGAFKSMLFAAAALLVGGAKGDVLFWMIDQSAVQPAQQVAFQYVSMVSGEGDDAHYYVNQYGNDTFASVNKVNSEKNHADLSKVSYQGSDTFYFALYDGDFKLLAKSAATTFDSVSELLYHGDPQYAFSAQTYKVSSFMTVPEPTGGMLVMLGLAALALRRRKDKIYRNHKQER